MRATRKVEAMDPVQTYGVSPAERDDWSWMVAEDPAFYIEERHLIRGWAGPGRKELHA